MMSDGPVNVVQSVGVIPTAKALTYTFAEMMLILCLP